MPAYKDERYNTWFTAFYYTDWQGKRVKKMKRGFVTKKEAQEWERVFLQQQTQDLDMPFSSFYELYKNDMKARLKLNTWLTKEHIIEKKILPYFQGKKMNEIKATDVMAWQNAMVNYRDDKGKGYSMTYRKTLHNQLSTLFNHAVRFYELKSNPALRWETSGARRQKKFSFGHKKNTKCSLMP